MDRVLGRGRAMNIWGRRGLLTAIAICLVACAEREQWESQVGRKIAETLCPIQAECGCETDLLISECEATVTREIGRNERRAVENGLELDTMCLDEFTSRLSELGSCGEVVLADGPAETCAVYSGTAEEGEPCQFYDYFPPMTDCRPGLECKQNECRTRDGFEPPPPGAAIGEECGLGNACAEGSYCQREYDDPDSLGVCVEHTPIGQPCSLPYECPLYCEEGICQPLPMGLCHALEYWWLARDSLP